MKQIDIESLPRLVAEGSITKHEGANQIWTDVYINPSHYGLGLLSADQKSDFLMLMHTKFEYLFDTYNPEGVKFHSYIRGFLRNSLLSFLREKTKLTAAEESIMPFCEMECEIHTSQIPQEKTDLLIASPPDPFKVVSPKCVIRKKIAQKTALILLLKSCCEADDDIISKVSIFTHFDKKEIIKKIERLRSQIAAKEEQRNKIIKRRDNAFFYHRKYFLELKNSNPNTECFRNLERRYKKQTESWKRQNTLLSRRFLLRPSNLLIAKELDLGERQIGFYISHADRTTSLFYKLMD